MLGEDPDGAHDRLAHIEVPRPLDDALDDGVHFPAQHLVQGLAQAQLGAAVPRPDQLSVGALEHWRDGGEVVGGVGLVEWDGGGGGGGEQSQRKPALAPQSHARTHAPTLSYAASNGKETPSEAPAHSCPPACLPKFKRNFAFTPAQKKNDFAERQRALLLGTPGARSVFYLQRWKYFLQLPITRLFGARTDA